MSSESEEEATTAEPEADPQADTVQLTGDNDLCAWLSRDDVTERTIFDYYERVQNEPVRTGFSAGSSEQYIAAAVTRLVMEMDLGGNAAASLFCPGGGPLPPRRPGPAAAA